MNIHVFDEKKDLGPMSEIDVFDQLAEWRGSSVVDVGCGRGDLAYALAERGADVLGIEPDPIQAEINKNLPPQSNITLVQGSATNIPFDDRSADFVIFCKSLHHIPVEEMDLALLESARVLKSKSGTLFILEPDIKGTFSQLVKPFHDETLVRAAALASLDRAALPFFETCEEYWFTSVYNFKDFDSFLARMTESTFNNIDPELVNTVEVRANFHAGISGKIFSFANPMRIRLYNNLLEAPQ